MKELHNGFKIADQLVVSIAIVLEFLCSVLKELKDVINGLAVLEFFEKWILGRIYPSIPAVFNQGCIKNGLKVRRGNHCR